MSDSKYPFNRQIDNLIMSSDWEISPEYATKYLAEYLAQLDLLQGGVPYQELELSKQRQKSKMIRIDQAGQVQTSGGDIARIRISGPMRSEDGLSSRGIKQATEDLRSAYADPTISGIFLEVQSGGGESLAGSLLSNAIQEKNKPVVVFTHLLASSALKGTLQADKIIASSPEVQIGSIGTMVSVNKRILQFYQERYTDIYATKSTNKNRDFRSLLAGDMGPVVERLDKVNQIFIDQVKKYRRLTGDVEDTLSGQIFQAEEAQERGLIDAIGTQRDALAQLGDLVNPNTQQFSFNQNSNNMSFLSKLIQAVNEKFGLSIKQDATEDDTLQAINEAQSIDDLRQELTDTIRQEVQAQIDQANNNTDQVDLQEIQSRLDTQAEELEALRTQNQELETSLARYVGDQVDRGKDGQSGSSNSSTPTPDQFKTVQGFNVEIEGKSKY